MDYQGTISYWLKKGDQETQILSTPINKVPELGEIIPIDTKMDKDWFEANFKSKEYEQYYNEGVNGKFKVILVQRNVNSHPVVAEVPFSDDGKKIIKMPSLMISETFEVHVEKMEVPQKKK